jgi:ABC-type dipeptide/oligopeptide/nickel transport system permease subunit
MTVTQPLTTDPASLASAAVPGVFRRDRLFQLGAGLVAVVVLSAILAPWVAPHDPLIGNLKDAYLTPPGAEYLLGTDSQGRDVLSRVLYGARISLAVGIISQTVAVTLGVTLGLVSGFYGRWVDALVMRLADVTLAFPTLLLLIAVAAAVQPSLPVVFLIIGAVGWAGMARLVRGQVLTLRNSEYVTAAKALGARDRKILFRHLLPNVRAQVIVAATLGMAAAIMAEAALSFIGLGAQPPTPSWGSMVAEGRDLLRVAPWVSFAPGVAIGVAVLGFNLLGDAIREAWDPRLRGR